MKELTLSTAGVLALALGIGLTFHWLYPRVEPSGELAGLFAFVAAVLWLLLSKGLAVLRKPNSPTPLETKK